MLTVHERSPNSASVKAPHDAAGWLGIGIYTVAEAARLTRVPPLRIRRWVQGYSYRAVPKGPQSYSPAVFVHELEPIDGALALTFLDLLEIRFVDAFRRHGVSWKTIRQAAAYAGEVLHTTHPFSTKKFKTDGRRIIGEFTESSSDRALLDLVGRQYEFKAVISHTLFEGIEFKGNEAALWWPLGGRGRVLLDPHRSFGQPIVAKEGVPTTVLARAVRAEGSVDRVARWFEVERASVRAAVEFEEGLAKAA